MATSQDKRRPGRPKNCRNCHLPKTYCECGRPTRFDAITVEKLFEAYSLGADDATAAFHAGIGLRTLRRWKAENDSFGTRIEELRQRPTLRALNRIFQSLVTDTASAWKWLERTNPKRFASVQKNQISGPEEGPIQTTIDPAFKAALDMVYGNGQGKGEGAKPAEKSIDEH